MFFFRPSGKLVQIEYALAAVAAGAPSVGIKGNKMIYMFLFLKRFPLFSVSPLESVKIIVKN